jgi:hypothetical protein
MITDKDTIEGQYFLVRGFANILCKQYSGVICTPTLNLYKGETIVARIYFHLGSQTYILSVEEGICLTPKAVFNAYVVMNEFQSIYHGIKEGFKYDITAWKEMGEQ